MASGQLAAAVAVLTQGQLRPPTPIVLAALSGVAALSGCLAGRPGTAVSIGALAGIVIYGGLLSLFAGSLRPGREPVATRLARRIHGPLTSRRMAYTRGVTRMWAGFFAAELGISVWIFGSVVVSGKSPLWTPPWYIARSDLLMAAALLSAELAVRSLVFKGEPHGSLRDMLRAAGRFATTPADGTG